MTLPVERPTLYPLIREYLNGRRKRGEISDLTARDTYQHTLHRFSAQFGARPLKHLTAPFIDTWLETIGHYAPATRRQYISTIRVFCQWLVDTERIARNPTNHVRPVREPRHVPRTLNEPEVAAVLDACPDARARAIVWLMVGCGLRCVEVSRLDIGDIDDVGRMMIVRGKGGHERSIPIPTMVADAIHRYLTEVGRTRGPLIRSRLDDRSRMSPRTLSGYMRRWMTEAGVKAAALDGRSAHALRRTAGSDVMERTGEIRIVQEMLGHARLETTARHYLRPVGRDKLREAMEGRTYGQAPVVERDDLARRRAERAG